MRTFCTSVLCVNANVYVYLAGDLRARGTWLARSSSRFPRSDLNSDRPIAWRRRRVSHLSWREPHAGFSPTTSHRSDGIIQHLVGSCCDLDNRVLRDRPRFPIHRKARKRVSLRSGGRGGGKGFETSYLMCSRNILFKTFLLFAFISTNWLTNLELIFI